MTTPLTNETNQDSRQNGSGTGQDYVSFSNAELISRITSLERQLREQTAQLASLTTRTRDAGTSLPRSSTPDAPRSRSPARRSRPFDPSLYSTRHIALKFAYLGSRYGGFEHANGNVSPKPTIEEVLWKALRKARLISPVLEKGCDESMDVLWGEKERVGRYIKGGADGGGLQEGENATGKVRLEVNWEGCQYSKCGRTDRGVSAFGQVIGIRVRSNRPVEKTEEEREEMTAQNGHVEEPGEAISSDIEESMPSIDADELSTESYVKPFDPIKDEMSYMAILNAILPPDIRILAWCPDPPPTFDARFSCRERRYKYFFTNPAFAPTPGPLGMKYGDGTSAKMRMGWLDIPKMREAAKRLEGLHDFRNLCKIDASKQMTSCQRRVTFADVVEFDETGRGFEELEGLSQFGRKEIVRSLLEEGGVPNKTGPKVYTFCVHGTAFLWHQVRCMVAVLFLVGQGLEEPSIIDELLDVEKNPGRPMYEMADDAPLVLWDCIFSDDEKEMTDSLNWLYAGDEATIPALTTNATKSDGKFGVGAVVDELWAQWREAKMKEVLAGSLLDLAIDQGDGSSFQRGAQRDPRVVVTRSQKVFDGSSRARIAGKYVPLMKKPKIESLEALNAKWANSRKARRDASGTEDTNAE